MPSKAPLGCIENKKNGEKMLVVFKKLLEEKELLAEPAAMGEGDRKDTAGDNQ